MMGKQCTLNDIVLQENVEDLVLPAPLLCGESSLSIDDTPEEESLSPYRVDSYCYYCNCGVRLSVVASDGAIFLLQQLLLKDLTIVCPSCTRQNLQHGRSQ